MDTNKENELMQNLERQVGGGDTGHLPDGRPTKEGERWMAVNPPGSSQQTSQQQKSQKKQKKQSKQAKQTPQGGQFLGQIAGQMDAEMSDIEKVTPEMVNRIEMYGTEAVYNAGEGK